MSLQEHFTAFNVYSTRTVCTVVIRFCFILRIHLFYTAQHCKKLKPFFLGFVPPLNSLFVTSAFDLMRPDGVQGTWARFGHLPSNALIANRLVATIILHHHHPPSKKQLRKTLLESIMQINRSTR